MATYKAVQVKLNPERRTREYCKFLQQESARVWNRTKNFFYRTYRKKGLWLSSTSLQKINRSDQLYFDEQFHLHSQSIQSVAQQFTDNLRSASEVRKENPDIRYPYKTKKYFRVEWKRKAITVKGRNIHLSNERGNKPLKSRLPRTLANCCPCTVQLFWRNGCYWLSLTIKVDDNEQPVEGDGVAACDMGEIHAMTITDGYVRFAQQFTFGKPPALVISGRKLREAKQWRNKRVAELQEAMSKCKKHSRRWNKLKKTKRHIIERTRRRIKDLNHKITRAAIKWCVDHNITTLVVGDLSGIAQNTKGRLVRRTRQKISQWSFYTQKQYLKYKGEEVGIEVVEVSEAYTSKTCPHCGNFNTPKNRNYFCWRCGLSCHREIVGAYNILTVYRYGVIMADDLFPHPTPKYLRILFTLNFRGLPSGARRRSSSSPGGGLMVVKGRKSMCDLASAVIMEGMPIMAGDRVRATLFGSKIQDFKVESTTPDGAVIISSRTLIRIKEEGVSAARRNGKITYEDIGGLHKEIQRVREMIELPLRYPQIFDRLGIDAPKGILLLGPPGCGKTLIARAVASETDAYFLSVSGPEVIHKFYGDSEAKLRQIFDQAAKNAPAIIFIDEIDSIAPKREKVVGDVEKRVVAQLLALMDGLKNRGQLIVIAATNIPNVLDPALRRPGRFDREISIGIPDKFGRLEILEIHTRGMPLNDDVDLERLAEITHGYVGADLEALCREAAMVALRRIIPNIDFSMESIPYEALLELQVTMDNFMRAFAEIEPSTTREVFTEVPDVKWDDVGGLKSIKQELQEAIEWPLKHSSAFEHTNITPPKGILLHGAPGTGKTMLAKAAATESEANFISIKGPQLLTKWVGESEQGVREVFKKARQASPCILFLDELDAMAPSRSGGSSDSHVSERVVSQLLTEMDGIEDMRGVVVLAATNRLDIIDTALLRPGRFDLLLELPTPDETARRTIFEVHTKNKPIADDIDWNILVRETDGRVGADIELICRRAAMLAIREFLKNKDNLGDGKPDYSSIKIRMEHFIKAMEILS